MARTSKRAKLAAFGNPLVDMIVVDVGGLVTEKYNLQLNVAQEMDTVQSGILQEITERSEDSKLKYFRLVHCEELYNKTKY